MTYYEARHIVQWLQSGARGGKDRRLAHFRQAYKTAMMDPYKFKIKKISDNTYQVQAFLMMKIRKQMNRSLIEFNLQTQDNEFGVTTKIGFEGVTDMRDHNYIQAIAAWAMYVVLSNPSKRANLEQLARS